MTLQRFKRSPVDRVSRLDLGGSRQAALVHDALKRHEEALASLPQDIFGLAPGSGGGSIAALPTRTLYRWAANGPYAVDTGVDGAWIVPTALSITAVWLHRLVAGSSGATILDLNRNGTTMYTNQGNRPTIASTDADLKVECALPNVTAVAVGDIITVDTDQIEGGEPESWTLTIEGA